jgi:hypothetical protein
MIRLPALACVILAIALFVPSNASAQIYYPQIYYPPFHQPAPYQPPPDPADAPVEVGGYLNFGSASKSPGPVPAVGVYAQWNRFGWCPGLDLRLQGGSYNVRGVLVGPRLAYQPKGLSRIFRPYIEVLTGPNELPYSGHPEPRGVTVTGVVGVDLHYNSHFAWRVLEYSNGDFTGVSGFHPQTVSTGIVVHLP